MKFAIDQRVRIRVPKGIDPIYGGYLPDGAPLVVVGTQSVDEKRFRYPESEMAYWVRTAAGDHCLVLEQHLKATVTMDVRYV